MFGTNRYLTPTTYQYQSQFVPTEIPFDLIAKSGAMKQQQQEVAKQKEQQLLDLTPAGIDTIVSPTGEIKRLNEKIQSQKIINDFNQEIIDLTNKPIDRMSSDYVAEVSKLRKEYSQIKGAYSALTYAGVTRGDNTFGLTAVLNIQCKFDSLICQNKTLFKLPLWYL